MNEKSILIGMLVFRLFNYLIVQTYYVPDEYWQSMEVAHNQAFGYPFLSDRPSNIVAVIEKTILYLSKNGEKASIGKDLGAVNLYNILEIT